MSSSEAPTSSSHLPALQLASMAESSAEVESSANIQGAIFGNTSTQDTPSSTAALLPPISPSLKQSEAPKYPNASHPSLSTPFHNQDSLSKPNSVHSLPSRPATHPVPMQTESSSTDLSVKDQKPSLDTSAASTPASQPIDNEDQGNGSLDTHSRKRKKENSEEVAVVDVKKAAIEKKKEEARKRRGVGEVAVINDEKLVNIPAGMENKTLERVIYTGAYPTKPYSSKPSDLQLYLLPKFSKQDAYATIQVGIPAELLLFANNAALQVNAVWGTDVYTDDSDVVAMIVHSGHYKPADFPKDGNYPPSVRLSITHGKKESEEEKQEETNQVTTDVPRASSHPFQRPTLLQGVLDPKEQLPDHDLLVTLRVLPRLVRYTGSFRYGMASRGWGIGHQGESVAVVKVEKREKGTFKKILKEQLSGSKEPVKPESPKKVVPTKTFPTIKFINVVQ